MCWPLFSFNQLHIVSRINSFGGLKLNRSGLFLFIFLVAQIHIASWLNDFQYLFISIPLSSTYCFQGPSRFNVISKRQFSFLLLFFHSFSYVGSLCGVVVWCVVRSSSQLLPAMLWALQLAHLLKKEIFQHIKCYRSLKENMKNIEWSMLMYSC